MASEIHYLDIGTAFDLTIQNLDGVVDISSATTKTIKFRKPNGTVVDQPGVFKTDGTDGILRYVSILDDLDKVGTWRLQAFVTLISPAGSWHSNIDEFDVHYNLS